MKKFLAALLVLVMVLSSVAFAEITDFTGEWYASAYGMPLTLTVNGDGTVNLSFMDESHDGKWVVEDGVFYINKGESDETTIKVGEDSMFVEELNAEFTREPVEAIVLPGFVAADDITAFDGTWTMTYVSAFGMTFDSASAKAEMGDLLGMGDDDTAVIENGKVAMFGAEGFELPFVDGHLCQASATTEIDTSVTVDLCEDGSIACTMLGFVTVYFTRAE